MTTRTLPIGFHFGSQSTAAGWGDYIRALDAAGIPAVLMSVGAEGFGDIKGVWDNGSTVDHLTVIRCLSHNDVPFYGSPIDAAVSEWLNRYVPTIGPDVRQYHQRIITKHGNELDKNQIQWLADFYTALHPALLARMGWSSHRIGVFGFASGEPELEQWGTVLPFIELAGRNPDKFVFVLHEYSYDVNTLFAGDGWKVGRFKKLYDICDAHNIPRPHVVSHEFGWIQDVNHEGKGMPPLETAVAQIDAAAAMYASYPTYLGAGIWTLQKFNDTNDLSKQIQKLIEPVKQLALTRRYEVDEDPSMDCQPRVPYGRKYLVSPQDVSLAEWLEICEKAFPDRNTVSFSHDDAGHAPGVTSNTAVLHGIEPESQQVFIDWYATYYPETVVMFPEEAPTWTKLPIPHMSQLGTGASQRSNDCGAACVAMIVNGMTANKPTVDNVAIAYQSPANSYMNFPQLDVALNGYGMDGTHKRPYMPSEISTTITSGKPVIVLVWYQSLPQKFSTFNGSHFIVVYGTNQAGNMLYRDPLATNGNELYITYDQLEKAMRDAQNSGNHPNQGMDCVKKNEPPPAQTVDTLRYFVPSGQYGRKIVMRVGSGTQPMQLEKRANDVILRKGDGLWIGGIRFQDSEQWRVVNGQVQKGIDTSDGGNGGRDAYDLAWAQWIPQHVEVGKTYRSTPTVRRFDRTTCVTISSNPASDYLYIKALVPSWTSPANPAIVLQNVLVIEWRSGTPDLSVPPTETYYFAKEIGYVGWGTHFINEIADGQAPLTGKLDCGQ